MHDTDPKLATLFAAAVDLDSPDERSKYLARECPDPQMRAEVESLLAAHEQPDTLFARKTILAEASGNEQIGTMIGRYKLLEAIGEGGFGTVWLAEQKEPVRRKVALKVVKLGMDTKQVVARFEAERQALALMDHPNIARVLDAGATDTGRPYFVMELVRGIPITRFCDENRLTTHDRLDLFIKVCHAVQHAHQKGIIHRDLKPSNVLVTLHDGVPVPKVIDFGIAKATQQELTDKTIHTLFQQFIGTPAYVSPEQAEMSGLDIDTRSDIYSLGVLLYELLTGVTPLNARTLVQSGLDEMRRIIREEEPKRPSTHLSTLGMVEATTLAEHRREKLPVLVQLVRGDLDWIVMKCLEKDRTRRYETVNGLAADLKRHLNNEPVLARPPSKLYEFQKTVRRHKLGFAAAGAVMVALMAGIAVSAWQAARAEENARKVEESLYLNRMALAHWNLTHEPPNILEAERLLDSCKRELRGWEWDYLRHQWMVEPYVLRDPGQRGINSLAFSTDDRYLAAAGADGKVTVWDVATRQAIRAFTADTNSFVFSVMFDPSDATRLVSAGWDKQVKLWDWTTTNVLHSWPIRYGFQLGMSYAVAFSPDGQWVAASVGSGIATIWNATTGEELCSVTHRGEASNAPVLPVGSVAFSPDGQRLATGGVDGIVCVWDARSGEPIKTLGRPTNPIAGMAFTKDGQRLIAASFDYSVMVFDLESGAMLWSWRAHTGSVLSLALSPDNKRLATGSEERTLKLWAMNWAARTNQEVLTFRDFTKAVQCASFSHDGRRLAACSTDGTVRMWDGTQQSPNNRECVLTVNQGMEVRKIILRPDRLWLASGGERLSEERGGIAPVAIWNARTGGPLQTFPRESLYLFSVAFSPDGRFLAATGDDRDQRRGYAAEVWDLASGSPSFHTEAFPGEDCLYSLSYSPDGRHLVGGAADGSILVWNTATGKTNAIVGQQSGAVFHLAFSPNGRYLASATQTEQARVWDGARLDVLQTNAFDLGAVVGEISDTLAFSPDSRRLAVATDDRLAMIWDMEHRAKVLDLRSGSFHGFRALAFSPDGRWIASGGSDSKVKLWDAMTGELLRTFRGHKAEILTITFLTLPEGPRLLSGSRDGTIKYWDLRPQTEAASTARQ